MRKQELSVSDQDFILRDKQSISNISGEFNAPVDETVIEKGDP